MWVITVKIKGKPVQYVKEWNGWLITKEKKHATFYKKKWFAVEAMKKVMAIAPKAIVELEEIILPPKPPRRSPKKRRYSQPALPKSEAEKLIEEMKEKQYLREICKPVRNPFPKEDITSTPNINEGVKDYPDCRNCGVCRYCLEKLENEGP